VRNQIGVVKPSKKRVNSQEFVKNNIGEFKKLNGRENERTCEKKRTGGTGEIFFSNLATLNTHHFSSLDRPVPVGIWALGATGQGKISDHLDSKV
jgi:hypothetical protein